MRWTLALTAALLAASAADACHRGRRAGRHHQGGGCGAGEAVAAVEVQTLDLACAEGVTAGVAYGVAMPVQQAAAPQLVQTETMKPRDGAAPPAALPQPVPAAQPVYYFYPARRYYILRGW